MGTRLLAVVGEQAAVDEAHALCPPCVGVPVKSLESDWFPTPDEMHPNIAEKTLEAMQRREEMVGLNLASPFRFSVRPHEKLWLDREKRFFLRSLMEHVLFRRCKGTMTETEVSWETKTIVGGIYMVHAMRSFMQRRPEE